MHDSHTDALPMNWVINQLALTMDGGIGAFEAKAQLSCPWLAVEPGERFTITVRGKPVADQVPHRSGSSQCVAAAIAASSCVAGAAPLDLHHSAGRCL